MIKILGLALYGPMAASTRYRLEQYVTGLARQGIDLQIRYLLGNKYLLRTFNGKAIPWSYLLRSGWDRIGELRRLKCFDAAMIHCELFPLMPGWVEQRLLSGPYIYDFDDAFYLKYRIGRLGVMRPLLGNKFDIMMHNATAITAGNKDLAEYARGNNINTHLLPTVVDTDRYIPSQHTLSDVLTVGWVGTPSTAPYLAELVGPLSQIGTEFPVKLVVIGGKAPLIPNISVEEILWSEHNEVALINTFDVGVMPLPDDDWARGKCAFKLIQYMSCAVPVIASRVGANIDVVQKDCGILVSGEQEWVDALRFLRNQPEQRQTMGLAGRERIEQNYSLHCNLPVLADVIRNTIAKGQ